MSRYLFSVVVVAAVALVASCNFILDAPDVATKDDIPEDVIFVGKRPTYDEEQFVGKNILVTGGSSGIGYGTALTFARFGAHVVICSRDSNASWFTGAGAVEKIMKDDTVIEKKGTVRWIKADVSNKTELRHLFDELEGDSIVLDYAVNNAGIVGATGLLNETTKYFGGKYDAVRNNLMGTVYSLELEIEHFQKFNRSAAIVNLASVNGYRAAPRGPMYAASKFGILGLTRNVGIQYVRNQPTIRINAIAPGFTNTSLVWQQAKLIAGVTQQVWEGDYITPSSQLWKDNERYFLDKCPTGKMADPLDQANMIAFLLAKESELITGSIFTVDGLIGEK